jgi:hypothetical protein
MVLAVSLTGCSGAGGQNGGKDASKADSTAEPVRWPRYWATEEQAETGAQDDRSTHYFAGYDEASVVYNGQDVLRFLNPATGKSLWTWKKKGDYDPAKNEFHAGYGPLGFSEDGKEFLVQANLEGVLRFSAKNGNIVGRATLAPGMNLVQFGVAGPDFLLLRTEGGILDAKSGLSYYRTASS